MTLLVALLLLAVLFGGLGFAVHALWVVAVIFLCFWAAAAIVSRV